MSVSIKNVIAPRVRMVCPEAPYALILSAVLDAARDFCKRTQAWRVTHAAQIDYAGGGYIDITPVTGTLTDIRTAIWTGDRKLTKKSFSDVRSEFPGIDSETQDYPDFIQLSETTNRVELLPAPAAAVTAAMTITYVLMPAEIDITLDSALWDRWGEALTNGAVARLLRIPRKPWSDIQLANYYLSLYEEKVPEATSKAADGHMKGVIRKVKYGGIR